MKNFTLILLLLNFGASLAQYRKLPLNTNHYWQQSVTIASNPNYMVHCAYLLKVKADTVINGQQYKWIADSYKDCDHNYNSNFSESGFIRQDTIRKLVIMYKLNKEYILYNFNKVVGDTAMLYGGFGVQKTHTLVTLDSLLLSDGFYHRRYTFSQLNNRIIEGVGSMGGLLTPGNPFEAMFKINCVGQISPALSIYSAEGIGTQCPLTTGISKIENKGNQLLVYPNPATNQLNIQMGNSIARSVEIKNIFGQSVMCTNDAGYEGAPVNISDLQPGMYFVELNYGDGIVSRPFIKN